MFLTDSESRLRRLVLSEGAAVVCRSFLPGYGCRGLRQIVVLLVLLLGVFNSHPLQAQASSGTITGLVTDEKGAVVGGAEVTVASTEGTVTTKTVTSGEGVYTVPSIPPGTYTVVVQAKGFGRNRISDVGATVGGVTKVDVMLTVGAVTDSVTVTSNVLLSPTSSTLQTAIDQSTIVDLPFPERNVLAAVLFAPGVVGDAQANDGIGSEIPNAYSGPIAPAAGLTIGGSRDGANPQLVDGSDLTLAGYPRTGVTFSGDAIRSITVQSIGLTAQYGRAGGGVINQASKAGSDRYHGALRWRHRDPFFELVAPNTGGAAPAEHLNLFTVAVGGPIPLPFHKHKTFFFAAFEPLRNTNGGYQRKRFLTPDEIAGRFNDSYDILDTTILKNQGYAAAVAAPRAGGIYYQFARNTQGFPTGPRLATGQWTQAANNDISAQAAQNPITKYLLSLQPTPGNPTRFARFFYPDGHYDPDGMNGYGIRGVSTNDNRYSFRIDENLTDRDRIFVRYTNTPVSGTRYDYNGLDSPMETVAAEAVKSDNVAVNYVRTVSNNKVNEFRATFLRNSDAISPAPASLAQDFDSSIGLPPTVRGAGLAGFNFNNNLTSLGQGAAYGTSVNENYGFGDDFSILLGRHSIKFGADYRALQLNRYDENNLYGGNFACNTSIINSGGSTASSCVAGYILGLFGSYTVNTPHNYYYRWKYGAAYVQDDWRVLPSLTLNVGLRYNVETPRMEKFNYQGSFVPNGTGTLVTNGKPYGLNGGFAFSGTNGLSTTLWPVNYMGFEPRIGFAYQPKNFMTVRAAYTMMHTPLTGLGNNIVPDLTSGALTIGNNGAGGANSTNWVNLITNPISSAAPGAAPPVSNALLETWNGTTYLPAVTQSKSVPYVQLWSMSLQFQVNKGAFVEADYVGQKGTHLYSTPVPVNDPPINTLLSLIKSRTNLNTTSVDPRTGLNTTTLQQMRPFPQFSTNPIYTAYDRTAGSNYHALYLTAKQQTFYGLTLFSSFSWSKSLDDASSGTGGPGDTQIDVYGYLYPQGYTTVGDYSLSTFDVPVHLSIGYVWDLPIGRSKKWFANTPRWADLLVGGWNVSSTVNTQSGYPLSIVVGSGGRSAGYFCSTSAPAPGAPVSTACNNGTALNDVTLRPNRVPGVPIFKKNWKKDPFGTTTGGGIINPAAFSMPGSLNNPQFGNVPRTLGDARNPRSIIANASLRKRFDVVPEKLKLELWTDVINVLNHQNYFLQNNSPAVHGLYTTIAPDGSGFNANPQFGTASALAPGPRQINLGVAITF